MAKQDVITMRLTFNYTPANIPDGSSRCANISNILFFFNFLVIDLFLNLSFYIIDSSVLVFWDYQDYLLFQNAFIWNIEPEFSSININSSEVISDQRPLLTMLLFFLIQSIINLAIYFEINKNSSQNIYSSTKHF